MIRVALLDDDEKDRECIKNYLTRFQKEKEIPMEIFPYGSSIEFLEKYRSDYDIVILDIEMPGTDGMEVAREIRRLGGKEVILFITNLVQYAIRGYEVSAIDFVVKPVEYFLFEEKFLRAVDVIKKRVDRHILLYRGDDVIRVSVDDIYYLDKDRNYLVYHTAVGDFRERGTMQSAKEKIGTNMFSECMSGCLVNLRYVKRVDKTQLILTCGVLPISRGMRRRFLLDFMEYVGGGC